MTLAVLEGEFVTAAELAALAAGQADDNHRAVG
jgi:hypothetical protein